MTITNKETFSSGDVKVEVWELGRTPIEGRMKIGYIVYLGDKIIVRGEDLLSGIGTYHGLKDMANQLMDFVLYDEELSPELKQKLENNLMLNAISTDTEIIYFE